MVFSIFVRFSFTFILFYLRKGGKCEKNCLVHGEGAVKKKKEQAYEKWFAKIHAGGFFIVFNFMLLDHF